MSNRADDYTNDTTSQPTFEDALEELKTDDETMPSLALVAGLSNLDDAQVEQFKSVWQNLDEDYRLILTQMLVDTSHFNFTVSFNPIGHAILDAEQADVRQAAIELLWLDESVPLMYKLINIAQNDPSENVRAEAVRSLGRFVWIGEMLEIPDADARAVQDFLLTVINNPNESMNVRRLAIESIGNCTREDIPPIITEAYKSNDPQLRLSAIIAMGRSCDSRWEGEVISELENNDDEMRLAATVAAANIQLTDAVGQIKQNLRDSDRAEQETIVWALGEIGGSEASRVLDDMLSVALDEEDDEFIEQIEEAISTANLMSGNFMMLDFDETLE